MILHLLVVLSRAGHREKGCLLLALPSFKITTWKEAMAEKWKMSLGVRNREAQPRMKCRYATPQGPTISYLWTVCV